MMLKPNNAAYGQSKAAIQGQKETLSVGDHFLAGMMTGAVVSFVESPIDLLKSQVRHKKLSHLRSLSLSALSLGF